MKIKQGKLYKFIMDRQYLFPILESNRAIFPSENHILIFLSKVVIDHNHFALKFWVKDNKYPFKLGYLKYMEASQWDEFPEKFLKEIKSMDDIKL